MGFFDGNIAGGFVSGLRQSEQDNQRRQEIEDQRRRQAARDAQESTLFQQGQEDRSHTLERRPVIEQRQDEDYTRGVRMDNMRYDAGKIGLENAQHEQDRRPVLEQQHDQAFGDARQAAEQERHIRDLRMQQEKLQLSDAQLRQMSTRTAQLLGQGLASFDATGDTASLVRAINSSAGQTGGFQLESLEPVKGGGLVAKTKDGRTVNVSDRDHLEQLLTGFAMPGYIIQNLASQQDRRNDPADVREAKFVAGITPLQEGETTMQRLRRSYDTVTTKNRSNPQDVHQKVYQEALKSMAADPQWMGKSQQERSDAAFQEADDYVSRLQTIGQRKPQQGGSYAADADVQFVDPRQPAQAQGGAPQQASPHGKVVRTGTRNGQRVAQYEDGTIAPIQQ